MNTTGNNWKQGEVVTLPWEEEILKDGHWSSYKRCTGSRYICIREATDEKCGILMKVLEKTSAANIMTVKGEPFCKDDRFELFDGYSYSSYPFPTSLQIQEALSILHDNHRLLLRFDEESMHVNPHSTFWVNSMVRHLFFMHRPQYFDSRDGQLHTADGKGIHYRTTFVYFEK